MKLQASVGNAPHDVSLADAVYSLRLVAQTNGEKQRLAALLQAIRSMPPATLRESPPIISIDERKAK